MLSIQTIQSAVTKSVGRGGLVLQKYSPEILLTVGITGAIVSTIMACRATLKVEAIVEETKDDLDQIKGAKKQGKTVNGESYSEEDYTKDLAIAYVQSGLKFTKLYGPSVGFGVLSVGCILSAHGIMTRRQVGLVAAYNLVSEGFASYRKRVTDELGEEVDRQYRQGVHEESVNGTEVDPEGKTVKVKKKVKTYDAATKSDYARFFDQLSPQWRKDASMNLYFLKAQQNFLNDKLKANGHVFLNEVYDALGIPRSKAGQVVGWVNNSKDGDSFIDFDIYNISNGPGRDFVNGYNNAILLDFNVDGIIFDLI